MHKCLSILFLLLMKMYSCKSSFPLVVNTWPWPQATDAAWNVLKSPSTALDAVVAGCAKCEEDQCDGSVGFGGSPDESGETTLDAMIMDGSTMDIGAVGCLRKVKNAIGVARHVLENTEHTLLVGELATEFAKEMGFKEETLETNHSRNIWQTWKDNNCQPNFHANVKPDPKSSCGPYTPIMTQTKKVMSERNVDISQSNHDTIGMIVVDEKGNFVAGTSTNGLTHKIPGRVGDSPIPGAGAYAENGVGAAVATGDGDVMMRFLPAYQIVELMHNGATPTEAASKALERILKFYPKFNGALVGVRNDGEIGAACVGFPKFEFCVKNETSADTIIHGVDCKNSCTDWKVKQIRLIAVGLVLQWTFSL
uniref:N(4)-(Beta-N-acetylglucosaminyl)-L-asparaginase n=1 Tax=Phallusia mammillata TaxID=59560 RepID=A0A6F9D6R4_9ASCI|nr:N(4)-(Beta-N-acetylglucosaminyl)-L-asparaginase-like [Phallusia mammillata]